MTAQNEISPSVDPRPAWLQKFQVEGTPLGLLEVDGTTYSYTVVKTGLAKGLPYGVGFPSDTALFISEDVAQEDRGFIMTHEVREKTRFASLPETERCLAALQAELSDVQAQAPERYIQYVVQRMTFFTDLVKLYQQPDQATAVTSEFQQAILASRNHLFDRVLAILNDN